MPGRRRETARRGPGSLPIALATLAGLLPFVNKAFHVDDTLFLWAAKRIHQAPLDFYGFEANWYGFPAPMSLVHHNPPLAAYTLALAALPFGWHEVALHLAFLLPALGVALGVHALARELCGGSPLPALAVVACPVFLVSATNVMSDVLMLAFYVWAVACWVRAIGAEGRRGLLLLSAFLIALAALTKYFAISLIPLLLVYTVVRRRGWDARVLFLGVPVAVLLLYECYTRSLYGQGLLLQAMAYSAEPEERGAAAVLANPLVGLAFLGGGASVALCYAPLLWSRRVWLGGGLAGFAVLTAVLLFAGEALGLPVRGQAGVRWGVLMQLALFVLAGVQWMAIAALDLREERDADALLLLLWVLGTFGFCVYVNWTVNGRALLPLVPAASLLLVRRLERVRAPTPAGTWGPLVPAACLALVVTWADFSWANQQRSASQRITGELREFSRRIWFLGHWGFQYYMEELGAKPLDTTRPGFDVDDYLVVPINNTNSGSLPEGVRFLKKYRFQGSAPCATMGRGAGAGFYSALWGPLPWACGRVPAEEFWLYQVERRPVDSSARASSP